MSTFPELQSESGDFAPRHIGLRNEDLPEMLSELGVSDLGDLIDKVIPESVRDRVALELPPARSEAGALADLRETARKNQTVPTFIGQGYYGTITPPVIQRNVLENPGWYTAYTPYQAEISQGRLEALLNFQTMICELTAMPVANASLLDEATAAAEAMAMCAGAKPKGSRFFVSENCFPQTIEVLQTRAEPVGIELVIGNPHELDFEKEKDDLIGLLLQYPGNNGLAEDFTKVVEKANSAKCPVVVAADLLALTLLKPPGEWGADIVVGSAQRFGVPVGFGGPHAGYIACSDAQKRRLPGRLIGVSRDTDGRPALRLSLQTREQHIRREKATSNICTAQVLLAVMAGLYATWHGPKGLRRIAGEIAQVTGALADAFRKAGFELEWESGFFDTIFVKTQEPLPNLDGVNLRRDRTGWLGISIDEIAVASGSWHQLAEAFGLGDLEIQNSSNAIAESQCRQSSFLEQPVFNRYHTESELLRYLRRLEGKDIALNWSMIPLGSCTMKLNAAAEMFPVSWPEFSQIHPFAPESQTQGYREMIDDLERWLAEITGFAAVSLQPNAGSQGEYAGLLAIRAFHAAKGAGDRDVCLIPTSAHGTNPASAVMAGFRVVPVRCDEAGNIDLEDIRTKVEQHSEKLAALMITYPSTHGVFEEAVVEVCELIHQHGGQVYMDGANMNAQVGLCRPGLIGADVCHLNLHKTFCIPHGGGGPGIGPIGVAQHLAKFLPGHCMAGPSGKELTQVGAVSAAQEGSASILPISWMYIAMMGPQGLTCATQAAILNANYIAARLDAYFPVLYKGSNGLVAHECIIDLRPLKEQSGIDVEDVAKRLIDFGFHAPTMSWPVAGTLMIEPTESESKEELDRFCEAMIQIHAEIQSVIRGEADATDNPLKNAPHPAETVISDSWDHAYSRELAAYPLKWVRERKFWPSVSRIDNVFGDRNLVCTCEGMEQYAED